MNMREALSMSIHNIRQHTFRSVFTTLGVIMVLQLLFQPLLWLPVSMHTLLDSGKNPCGLTCSP